MDVSAYVWGEGLRMWQTELWDDLPDILQSLFFFFPGFLGGCLSEGGEFIRYAGEEIFYVGLQIFTAFMEWDAQFP